MTIRNKTLAVISVTAISIAASSAAYASMGGYSGMMGLADTDKDGTVSCSEYKAMQAEKFKKFDTNNDGGLTAEEIIAGREAMKLERMKAFVAKADADKDGKVSVEEFQNFSKSKRGDKMHRTSSDHKKYRHGEKGKFHRKMSMHHKYAICD